MKKIQRMILLSIFMACSILAIAGTIRWVDAGSYGYIESLECSPSDGENVLLIRGSQLNINGSFQNTYSDAITVLDHKAQIVIAGAVVGFASGQLSGVSLPIRKGDYVNFHIKYYIPTPLAPFKCNFELFLVDQVSKAAFATNSPAIIK